MPEVVEGSAKKMTKDAISVIENLGESLTVSAHKVCCHVQ